MISNAIDQLFTVMIWPVVIGGLILLFAGARRKVVIYYDNADFGLGMAVIAVPIVWLVLLIAFMPREEAPGVGFYLVGGLTGLGALAVSIYCAVHTFKNAIKHNRNLALGIIVGTYKILFVALILWLAVGAVAKLLERRNLNFRDMLIASILLFIAGVAMKCMINGEKVYRAKGWDLPRKHDTQDASLEWPKVDQPG